MNEWSARRDDGFAASCLRGETALRSHRSVRRIGPLDGWYRSAGAGITSNVRPSCCISFGVRLEFPVYASMAYNVRCSRQPALEMMEGGVGNGGPTFKDLLDISRNAHLLEWTVAVVRHCLLPLACWTMRTSRRVFPEHLWLGDR